MRAVEFARHLFEAVLARPRARQFVGRREPQLVCGCRSVAGGVITFPGRVLPIGRCSDAIVGSLGSIRCGPCPVTSRPCQDVLAGRIVIVVEVVQARQLVATLRAAIAERGSSITLLRRAQSVRRTLVTAC
jgi:hypothetical protein